jgi:hypothetical protein
MLRQPVHVVGEDGGFVTGAGDGNVAESGAEQVGMDASVHVDGDAPGGESWALWLVSTH